MAVTALLEYLTAFEYLILEIDEGMHRCSCHLSFSTVNGRSINLY